ncbi:coiled-coil domain-containing protein AGAP005037 isoform X3 [Anopheles gambiae]|nr:coiled-coil domain-containing protein AGAP005037 isoform X3 [Anopheles gambiae]
MLQYQAQTQPPNIQRSLDFEQTPQMRVYTPTNQGPLFDDDPGIMSEAETASTGFRRGGKQRSSLPVVRTPSKTLERPLGLVFLQYRSETKRALLPNEITSIDTVRALFVRSFPRQLTMQYLEGPNVKIYIHDSSKDMFYELEDVRSHLREIRDRSVLRLFESNEVSAPQVLPGGQNIPQPLQPAAIPNQWDQEQSYFSEPEFDSEYQHQHIHKSKQPTKTPYYVGTTQTLPRGMYSDRTKGAIGVASKPIRSYGSRGNIAGPMPYTTEQLYNIPDGYMSSPERSGASRGAYEEPYYSQYGTRSATVTPIIDEEQGDISIADDQYAMYGVKNVGRIPRVPPNQMYDHTRSEDLHRIRVEHMERQLANLTGLVQKALTQNPQLPLVNNSANILNIPGQYRNAEATGDGTVCTREKPPKLGKSTCHKSVSFEKSVSFSDDIQGVPKSHSPQHSADTKPPKPAIKSSTLPRTSSQERDRLKPPPPPKPLVMIAGNQYRTDLTLAPEVYNQLRGLQKKAMDLRTEVRTLRRLTQTQAVAVREDIKDTFMRIRATLLSNSGFVWGQGDKERTNLTREEEIYKQEVIRLEKDLADLESSVEGLRGEVINRRTRVNMVAVEDMALVLSRASKTVAELKMRFPVLQQGLRNLISNEMEHVCREEAFLKDEPDRLENALRRCKKLTGTLVTLKRLASVQEQRLPIPDTAGTDETIKPPETHNNVNKPIPSPRLGTVVASGGIAPENALDALLDELQTFAKPPNGVNEHRPDDSTSDDSSQTLQNSITTKISQSQLYPSEPVSSNVGLRRLHSYPSGSDTDTSPPQPTRPTTGKPPVPERNAELLSKVNNKRVPPPPPPRTSSRSPLASPTSPHVPQHHRGQQQQQPAVTLSDCEQQQRTSEGTDSGSESVCSDNSQRQLALELRHQELLKKQRQLQEQYQRLQQMSKNAVPLAPTTMNHDIKKTGSESNLPLKMGYNMTVSGSMKNLCGGSGDPTLPFDPSQGSVANNVDHQDGGGSDSSTGGPNSLDGVAIGANGSVGTLPPHLTKTTNKVYETDIL